MLATWRLVENLLGPRLQQQVEGCLSCWNVLPMCESNSEKRSCQLWGGKKRLYTTCSFFMSTVAFSLTSCFDPRMLQNKTLLSFEHVTNWSPPFENATWRTWPHHGLHILVFAQNKITSSVWPWRTVASTLGVSSTSRLYSSSQLTASSRRLRKIFNNPQNENKKTWTKEILEQSPDRGAVSKEGRP